MAAAPGSLCQGTSQAQGPAPGKSRCEDADWAQVHPDLETWSDSSTCTRKPDLKSRVGFWSLHLECLCLVMEVVLRSVFLSFLLSLLSVESIHHQLSNQDLSICYLSSTLYRPPTNLLFIYHSSAMYPHIIKGLGSR